MLDIRDFFLEDNEYYHTEYNKTILYIHHTAGGHRPDWTVSGWESDSNSDGTVRRIATPFIIGGKSITDGDESWDGVIIRCFPENKWAWHLGAKGTNGRYDKISIGIEVCNYGPLTLARDGKFYNYVSKIVPEEDVVELPEQFRGYKYYHKYTDNQLEALEELLIKLGTEYGINIKLGLQEWISKESLKMPNGFSVLEQQQWLNRNGYVGKNGRMLSEDGSWGTQTEWAVQSVGKSAFEYNSLTYAGYPGIWSHTNIRSDKFDMSPQPNLKNMLMRL